MTCEDLQLQRLEAGGWKVPPAGTSGRSPAAAAPATRRGASAEVKGRRNNSSTNLAKRKMEGLDFRSRSKSVGSEQEDQIILAQLPGSLVWKVQPRW